MINCCKLYVTLWHGGVGSEMQFHLLIYGRWCYIKLLYWLVTCALVTPTVCLKPQFSWTSQISKFSHHPEEMRPSRHWSSDKISLKTKHCASRLGSFKCFLPASNSPPLVGNILSCPQTEPSSSPVCLPSVLCWHLKGWCGPEHLSVMPLGLRCPLSLPAPLCFFWAGWVSTIVSVQLCQGKGKWIMSWVWAWLCWPWLRGVRKSWVSWQIAFHKSWLKELTLNPCKKTILDLFQKAERSIISSTKRDEEIGSSFILSLCLQAPTAKQKCGLYICSVVLGQWWKPVKWIWTVVWTLKSQTLKKLVPTQL